MPDDCLRWRFTVPDAGPDWHEHPGVEVPESWLRAVLAVARDLRCLRHGRDVRVDRLMRELTVTGDYSVGIGWHTSGGVGGFASSAGLSMDAPWTESAVWVADTVQTELAGYEFVQWPMWGRHPLTPRASETGPVWVDPHTDGVVAAIGDLCSRASAAGSDRT